MRGRDEETGEFLSPSRSAQRRAALDVLELGEQLVAMSAAQLARLPVELDIASEFRYREGPLPEGGAALFVSQ